MKTCWMCKTEKPLDGFWKDVRQKDGKQKACIACQTTRNINFRADNPGYFTAKGRAAYRRENNAARYARYSDSFKEARAAARTHVRGRLRDLLNAARGRATKKSIPLSIQLGDLLALWEAQEGRCALTGLPMTFEKNPPGERGFLPWSPSLDRIDPDQGYTPNNLRLVCVIVNLALNRFGDAQFDKMCRAYVEAVPLRTP